MPDQCEICGEAIRWPNKTSRAGKKYHVRCERARQKDACAHERKSRWGETWRGLTRHPEVKHLSWFLRRTPGGGIAIGLALIGLFALFFHFELYLRVPRLVSVLLFVVPILLLVHWIDKPRIEDLEALVEGLLHYGNLTPREAENVKARLNEATEQLVRGETDQAVTELDDFVREVVRIESGGGLSYESAKDLIAAALAVIDRGTTSVITSRPVRLGNRSFQMLAAKILDDSSHEDLPG